MTKTIQNLLSEKAYWILNKRLTLLLGLDASLLLSDLSSKYQYYKDTHQLHKDGGFFNQKNILEDETTLSPYKQTEAMRILKDYNLISVYQSGMPSKNYYIVNEEVVNKMIAELH